MSKMILYHGSPEIIQNPEFGKGKSYNDYGRGFYCTEHLELAKEWSCTENADGYANQYELDMTDLSVLDLSSDEYTILHWLALLVEYRKFKKNTPVLQLGTEWLKEYYLIDLSQYDIVKGYRADDSYFAFAKAFLSNEISLKQLSYAMRLGKLGEQVVLKSPLAFENLQFLSYEFADNTIYYAKRKARNEDARAAYRMELARVDLDGLYMRDIIREEVMPNDARLR